MAFKSSVTGITYLKSSSIDPALAGDSTRVDGVIHTARADRKCHEIKGVGVLVIGRTSRTAVTRKMPF